MPPEKSTQPTKPPETEPQEQDLSALEVQSEKATAAETPTAREGVQRHRSRKEKATRSRTRKGKKDSKANTGKFAETGDQEETSRPKKPAARPEKAEPANEATAELKSSEDLLAEARSLYRQQRYQEAISLLEEYLDLRPDDQDALGLFDDSHQKKVQKETGVEGLEQEVFFQPTPVPAESAPSCGVEELLEELTRALEDENLSRASGLLSEVEAMAPDHPDLAALQNTYFELRSREVGRAALAEVGAEIEEKLTAGDLAAAEKALRQAEERFGADALEAYRNLVEQLGAKQKAFKRLASRMEELLARRDFDEAVPLLAEARAHYQGMKGLGALEGRFEVAHTAFRQADTHLAKAMKLLEEDRIAEAEERIRRAAEADEAHPGIPLARRQLRSRKDHLRRVERKKSWEKLEREVRNDLLRKDSARAKQRLRAFDTGGRVLPEMIRLAEEVQKAEDAERANEPAPLPPPSREPVRGTTPRSQDFPWGIAGLLVLILLVVGYFLNQNHQDRASQPEAPISSPARETAAPISGLDASPIESEGDAPPLDHGRLPSSNEGEMPGDGSTNRPQSPEITEQETPSDQQAESPGDRRVTPTEEEGATGEGPSSEEAARPEVEAPPLPPGVLGIDAFPWAEVLKITREDGEALELQGHPSTPFRLEVAPGTYQLILSHPPSRATCSRRVEVRSGETITENSCTFGDVDPAALYQGKKE